MKGYFKTLKVSRMEYIPSQKVDFLLSGMKNVTDNNINYVICIIQLNHTINFERVTQASKDHLNSRC